MPALQKHSIFPKSSSSFSMKLRRPNGRCGPAALLFYHPTHRVVGNVGAGPYFAQAGEGVESGIGLARPQQLAMHVEFLLSEAVIHLLMFAYQSNAWSTRSARL